MAYHLRYTCTGGLAIGKTLKTGKCQGNFFRDREIRENAKKSAKNRHVGEFYSASNFHVREIGKHELFLKCFANFTLAEISIKIFTRISADVF